MVQLDLRPSALSENYETILAILHASSPDDVNARRDAAIAKFREVGTPTTRDEEFKYLPLHDLNDIAFGPALGANINRSDLTPTILGEVNAITLRFVNGEFAPEISTEQVLPAGLTVQSIRERFEAGESINRFSTIFPLEGKLGTTNDERFAWLNEANFADGAYVHVARGAAIEHPILIEFVSTSDQSMAIYPRVFIELEDGALAKVVESYVGLKGNNFTCPLTEVLLGERANLEHVRLQNETQTSIHIGTLSIHQEADSVYRSTNVQFGAIRGRLDLNLWLNGEHTESTLDGASVGRGEQILDNHTRIDHAKPNCNSFEVYKVILGDKATGVFNGKIFVYEDAQKTDAKQTNQAILLSNEATINSKPQLEIFADDVKCTHGATVGQLREDAMFYLRARGIPRAQAEGMLVYAFAAEVLEKISIEEVRLALEKALFAKLEQ